MFLTLICKINYASGTMLVTREKKYCKKIVFFFFFYEKHPDLEFGIRAINVSWGHHLYPFSSRRKTRGKINDQRERERE